MYLKKLHLLNFRSFKDFLLPLENSALIYGDNGAGKTSILEGIHFALKSKSFRTISTNSMINKEADFFRISSNIQDCKRALEKKIGKALIKENYDSYNKYDFLPLLINNFSLRFLEQNKEIRRDFIDYYLFHVKHDYLEKLKRFRKILYSRNKALKIKDKDQIRVWTKLLVEESYEINKDRKEIISVVIDNLKSNILDKINVEKWKKILDSLEVSFFSGWKGEDLEISLREEYEEDLKKGYTKSGAHKFDLDVEVYKEKSGNIMSRGEQKLLILLTFFSFGEYLLNNVSKKIIYLIDDLPSELDQNNLDLAFNFLRNFKGQKLITSIKKIENTHVDQLIDL
tara:strand:- start:130 stop:1152 length:1023 start_codon:yes stop_codon:yes gene_type:complete